MILDAANGLDVNADVSADAFYVAVKSELRGLWNELDGFWC